MNLEHPDQIGKVAGSPIGTPMEDSGSWLCNKSLSHTSMIHFFHLVSQLNSSFSLTLRNNKNRNQVELIGVANLKLLMLKLKFYYLFHIILKSPIYLI